MSKPLCPYCQVNPQTIRILTVNAYKIVFFCKLHGKCEMLKEKMNNEDRKRLCMRVIH